MRNLVATSITLALAAVLTVAAAPTAFASQLNGGEGLIATLTIRSQRPPACC